MKMRDNGERKVRRLFGFRFNPVGSLGRRPQATNAQTVCREGRRMAPNLEPMSTDCSAASKKNLASEPVSRPYRKPTQVG